MKKLIIIAALFAGCTKEEIKPEESNYQSVTYTIFSKHPKHVFKYVAGEQEWHTDTIYNQNYSKTVQVRESDFQFVSQVMNVSRSEGDSINIKATCNGKKVENKYRFSNEIVNISVQLTQLK